MTNTVAMSASLCYSPNAETHDPMGEPFSKKRPAERFRLCRTRLKKCFHGYQATIRHTLRQKCAGLPRPGTGFSSPLCGYEGNDVSEGNGQSRLMTRVEVHLFVRGREESSGYALC
jgi:hypothetical protein